MPALRIDVGMREGGAPIGGVGVAGVAGEEPVVAGEILGGVLEFAVGSFVEFFDDFCAGGFGALVVIFKIFDEDGEALGVGAELGGSAAAGEGLLEHDPGVAEMELGAGGRVAVVIVQGEAENFGEPGDGLRNVGVDEVGEDGIWRNGAILNHGSSFGNNGSED
jgi:hypothetical protein